jgi:hypothetical protein
MDCESDYPVRLVWRKKHKRTITSRTHQLKIEQRYLVFVGTELSGWPLKCSFQILQKPLLSFPTTPRAPVTWNFLTLHKSDSQRQNGAPWLRSPGPVSHFTVEHKEPDVPTSGYSRYLPHLTSTIRQHSLPQLLGVYESNGLEALLPIKMQQTTWTS